MTSSVSDSAATQTQQLAADDPSGYNKPPKAPGATDLMNDFLDPSIGLLSKLESAHRFVDNFTDRQYDKVSGSVLDIVLGQVGESVRSMGNGYLAGGPKFAEKGIDEFFVNIWNTMQPELRESIMGPVPGDYSRYLMMNWPEEASPSLKRSLITDHLSAHSRFIRASAPSCCAPQFPPLFPKGKLPQPYTWARAHINYATLPADCTLFQKMANPMYIVLFILKCSSYTAVPIFGLNFLMMDKRDEYQLVYFILLFKSYQFLSGVYYAVDLSMVLYNCLNSAAYIGGEPRACDAMLSTSADDYAFIISMEVPRIMLIAAATYLLHIGYSSGGPGELEALAEVRIDAADGDLDGFADTVKMDKDITAKANVEDLSYAKIEAATEAARKKFGATKGTGNYLPYFMMWDFGFLGLIVLDNLWAYFWGRRQLWVEGGPEMITNPIFDDPMVRDSPGAEPNTSQ